MQRVDQRALGLNPGDAGRNDAFAQHDAQRLPFPRLLGLQKWMSLLIEDQRVAAIERALGTQRAEARGELD